MKNSTKQFENFLEELSEIVSVDKNNDEIELTYAREDFAYLDIENQTVVITNDCGYVHDGVEDEEYQIDGDKFEEVCEKYNWKIER